MIFVYNCYIISGNDTNVPVLAFRRALVINSGEDDKQVLINTRHVNKTQLFKVNPRITTRFCDVVSFNLL